MTINVEKFASYQGQDKDTSRTTHFEQTGDLTVTLKRGEHPDVRVGSQDGIVLIRLAIDDYDGVAVVELEQSHSLGNDSLATAEAALAHPAGRVRPPTSLPEHRAGVMRRDRNPADHAAITWVAG